MAKLIQCEDCGEMTLRTGSVQQYCFGCSQKHDLLRKRLWAREHPVDHNPETARLRREKSKEAGAAANRSAARGIAWNQAEPDLLWNLRVAVPFTYAASKNHIYTMTRNGHVALRRESRQIRQSITSHLKSGIHCIRVAHNKVWIDILVQKPDHKGDAVNVVDLVCDAVKAAVGVDDRWFSIRRLDWEIVKENPRLFVGIGQDTDVDCTICSYCGQIKPFSQFNQNKRNPLGIGRECRDCRRMGRVLAKRDRPVTGSGAYDSPTAMEVVG